MLYVEVWTNESRVFCVRWPSDSAVLTLDGSLFHRQGAKIEKSRDFAEQALFALGDGSTSRPADVVERSACEYKVYEYMSVYRSFSGLFLPRTDAAATLDPRLMHPV